MSNFVKSTRTTALAALTLAYTQLEAAVVQAREAAGRARQMQSESQQATSTKRTEFELARINHEKRINYVTAILQAYEALHVLAASVAPLTGALAAAKDEDGFIAQSVLRCNRDEARVLIIRALELLGQQHCQTIKLMEVAGHFSADPRGAHLADVELAGKILLARALGSYAIKDPREGFVAIKLTNFSVELDAATQACQELGEMGWSSSVQEHIYDMCLIVDGPRG
jgi:hypothetical protein